MGDHVAEYEECYYEEEEVISLYDTGLSTIAEGENESSTSLASDGSFLVAEVALDVSLHGGSALNLNGANRKLTLEIPSVSLVSPSLWSPMSEARKLSSLTSPLLGYNSHQALPGPAPLVSEAPFTLTNLVTGEDLEMGDDDDEYTFVSCSENDSMLGSSPSNLEEDCLLDGYDPCFSKVSPSGPLDFEATKRRLENALESRGNEERNGISKLDYIQRRLRYEIQRKMFKENMLGFTSSK